ncbi:MAG: 5-amino-6-(D-ribitylamino)uracil--L-tyrosine 4-hydroxyphenyl transferase CofH [Dehalococcoidia bacterium]|nr:MAG: 5-amino-6-(D-ribitylamino)uracil--L-tyrosine 4-hydroxyphenyl transferase CofH [Dehalococcoidia bacterium]
MLGAIDPAVARILDKSLEGRDISQEEAAVLFDAEGPALNPLILAADELRRRTVGGVVTYVINRNINFTNVCIKRCGFCAFSRGHRQEEAYFLPIEELVRRASEAWELGATEVCIQAGLPPKMNGHLYIDICRAIKKEVPDIHIHAFSPEEVLYGALRSRMPPEDYLRLLKDAGLDSLPGTAAEILDDGIRKIISPGRVSTADWVRVVTTAHRLAIPSSSTIMYGHVEDSRHKARHLALLRDIQKETGGFTEFVPLGFVYREAPMYKEGLVKNVRAGATGSEVLKMYAVSRLMLNNWIPNIQVSWVKEGPKLAQLCLNAGANDFGGTLIDESISSTAGAIHGQLMRPRELRALIRDVGRRPAQRSTTYEILRLLDGQEEPLDILDSVEVKRDSSGSYQRFVRSESLESGERSPSQKTPRPEPSSSKMRVEGT